MRLLLDTSVVVALRRGDPSARRAVQVRKETADEVGVSRLTHYELLTGASHLWKKYHDVREMAWLDEAFNWLTVYEIDEDVVRDAAELQAEALENGEPLPDMDLLVALSAKSGSEILTLDKDQLKMKEKLKSKGVVASAP